VRCLLGLNRGLGKGLLLFLQVGFGLLGELLGFLGGFLRGLFFWGQLLFGGLGLHLYEGQVVSDHLLRLLLKLICQLMNFLQYLQIVHVP
jgi:hypothetical protein